MSLIEARKEESLDNVQICVYLGSVMSGHVLVLIHPGHTVALSDVDVLELSMFNRGTLTSS